MYKYVIYAMDITYSLPHPTIFIFLPMCQKPKYTPFPTLHKQYKKIMKTNPRLIMSLLFRVDFFSFITIIVYSVDDECGEKQHNTSRNEREIPWTLKPKPTLINLFAKKKKTQHRNWWSMSREGFQCIHLNHYSPGITTHEMKGEKDMQKVIGWRHAWKQFRKKNYSFVGCIRK